MLITEKTFQHTLLSAARAAGWTCFHVVDTGRSARHRALAQEARNSGHDALVQSISQAGHARVTAFGFPDLVMRHDQHGILVAELKSDRPSSQPTAAQWDWLHALNRSLQPPANPYAPGRAHLWRPRDWPAIATQLGLAEPAVPCHCPLCSHHHGPPSPA